ncbi:Predicted pyrophosphatase or phosphodiesterase, AlkP superfamily [Flaviramulus basaltis]|uniref:Predicted pyrophosphatase or phosphodiesterase, AlkP superfamily n=1 Tax=Flaviramulus basaltis TaxID=369401 RepID=A0A1K2IF44_9FLAO|nr:nucleotide pyrophosphatase/phosphodiesterase family protein [Flaviramulus basaltis]SFZ90912.1 Predicted pyrophosphatase or phosphodiesterase, AlkP superfamily [Flaviramulus basaltis]
MNQTVVINIVGLSNALLKHKDLFLTQWIEKKQLTKIKPVLPAVTCAVQSTYLTGKWPKDHGIVANGWYFKDECEVKLWKQSNHLVEAPKIWDMAKAINPDFTCSNMFWWYNMYSGSDFNVTPRPQYRADGQKKPDCYSKPEELRDRLQFKLGTFPLFNFWGPNTTIKSTKWIADASKLVHDWHEPTLQLIYLPHLDYVLQKNNNDDIILKDLKELDLVCKDLINFYESKGVQIILLSEYGINPVKAPFHINRLLREHGYIKIREENGLELLDSGISDAFAMSDHQIAHVYINDKSKLENIKALLENCEEIDLVLDEEEQTKHHINHHRSGDLVVVAKKDFWFTYYYWLDDKKAPDFARNVDIHKKPGYDPVELFTDPKKKFMLGRIAFKLLKKKLGFRTMLNVIPLDATLPKGSHGAINIDEDYYPLFIHDKAETKINSPAEAIDVCQTILDYVFRND